MGEWLVSTAMIMGAMNQQNTNMVNIRNFLLCFLVIGLMFLSYIRLKPKEMESGVIRVPLTQQFCTGKYQNGIHRQYFKDRKIFIEAHCAGGKKEGVSVQYYPDGIKWREEFYVAGQLEGSVREYSRDGLLIREEHYKNGKLHGWQRLYKEGQLLSQQEFSQGHPYAPVQNYGDNGGSLKEDFFTPQSLMEEYALKSGQTVAIKESLRPQTPIDSNYQQYAPYDLSSRYKRSTILLSFIFGCLFVFLVLLILCKRKSNVVKKGR